MYALHQLSRKYPDFLIAEENEERVKDFRLRYKNFFLLKKSIKKILFLDYVIFIVELRHIQLN
jgi:hypothetical protein